MNMNELGAARLMGEIGEAEVLRIDGDTLIELKDLVITDDGSSFTTMGGHRIPITVSSGQETLSKILAGGGMLVIPLARTYTKVTLA